MPLGRIDEETVANIGTIQGGEARNIIPDTVVLEGMARSHDQDKLDRQLAAMRRRASSAADARGATVDFAAEEIYQTYRIAEDARPYREAAAAIRSLGLEVSPRKSGGGTDGNYFNAKGIPCVALPTGMVDEHATSEHIAIDDLVLACQTLVAIVTQPPVREMDGHETPVVRRHRGSRGRCHDPRRGRVWHRTPRHRTCAPTPRASTSAVDEMRALKPDGSKLDALSAKVDAALAKLDQFQAVTEGRYDSAISTLRANLDSFKAGRGRRRQQGLRRRRTPAHGLAQGRQHCVRGPEPVPRHPVPGRLTRTAPRSGRK